MLNTNTLILFISSCIVTNICQAASSTPGFHSATSRPLTDLEIRRSAGVMEALWSAPSDAPESDLAEIAADARKRGLTANPEQPATSLPHGIPHNITTRPASRPSERGKKVACVLFSAASAMPESQSPLISHVIVISEEDAIRVYDLLKRFMYGKKVVRHNLFYKYNR